MVIFPQNRSSSAYSLPIARQATGQSFSGMAQAGSEGHLVVHDTKAADGQKVSAINANSGALESVSINWSKTDTPQDLEAVASVDGQQRQFMTVEGSRYNGRTPHIFLFDYANGKGESLKQFDLPDLPYEVEGMVTQKRPDGNVLVVLGGRGDGETAQGQLHWGIYHPQDQTLAWSPEGKAGVPVTMPQHLGDNERPISDLHIADDGDLWAAGCVDNGDEGPFESLVYRIGTLKAGSNNPITLTLDHPYRVPGEKIEALDSNLGPTSRLLAGTDNESFGGSLQTLLGVALGT